MGITRITNQIRAKSPVIGSSQISQPLVNLVPAGLPVFGRIRRQSLLFPINVPTPPEPARSSRAPYHFANRMIANSLYTVNSVSFPRSNRPIIPNLRHKCKRQPIFPSVLMPPRPDAKEGGYRLKIRRTNAPGANPGARGLKLQFHRVNHNFDAAMIFC